MTQNLKAAVSQLIDSCGREYEFPAAGKVKFPTPEEGKLFDALSHADISDTEKIVAMSDGRDWSDCYSLAIFGIRLAILGVRSASRQVFRLGLLAMLAGSPKLDWRDTLRALAIFEDCGRRLGFRFQSDILRTVIPSEQMSLYAVVNGFFERSEEMRTVDVMGIKPVGVGDELTFISKSMR